jgi:uncharacterized membrane protein (UPF0127 family)
MLNSRKSVNRNIRVFLALFFALTALSSLNVMCKKNNYEPPQNSTNKNNAPKIPFVKQGEVYFEDRNKSMVKKIDVEIADNEDKRHLGLMYREKMEEDQGMLFIFPAEEPESFYMKNTIIPLDIIFINSKRQLVKIYKYTTPYSEQDLPSIKPIRFVVEVNAGFCDKYNIKEGDFIDWRRF